MEWTTIICALIAALIPSGGVAGYVFLREDKKSKQLDNDHKANEEWQDLVEKHKQREEDLEKALKDKDAIIEKKDGKIDSLYREKGELMMRNDKLSSKVAVLTITRCKVVGCANRVPPMGSRETDEEQNQNEKQGNP